MDREDGSDLLTPAEAARVARCSTKSVYRWAASGLIGRVKLGRLIRIRRDDLAAFIARNHEPPSPERSEAQEQPEPRRATPLT